MARDVGEDEEVDQGGTKALLDRDERKGVNVVVGMPHCDGAVVVVAERRVQEACVAGACRIHGMLRRMAS